MEATSSASPVSARGTIDIDAEPRQVWSVLADIEGWPTWNPAVRSARIDGDLEVATAFSWVGGLGTHNCVLRAVDAPRALAWKGRVMGVGFRQTWSIEPEAEATMVTTERAFDGILARLLKRRLREGLQDELDAWLELLQLEVETRADEADATVEATASTPLPGTVW